ncbi:ATP--guanido phosphotransferase [Verrucomicrobiota bacterium]
MIVDEFVRNPGSWLSSGQDMQIVISSRVRLARNVRDSYFPGWIGEKERVELCNGLRGMLVKAASLINPVVLDMSSLAQVDKEVLKERHLISNEFSGRGLGSALVVSEDERIAIMINEEDHLRLQAMSSGINLEQVWKKIDAVDSELEKYIRFAYSSRLGYLTSCPSNVGTGLRASVMMHLPGLRLTNEIESVVKGLHRTGFEVRGLSGEGTEASGNMFQISNRITLGEREEVIIRQLTAVVEDVVGHERNARARLMEQKHVLVMDHIGRALGVLMHARMLTSVEVINFLSALRFGIELDIVQNLSVCRVNEVMLLTQPGHLLKIAGKDLSAEDRDILRAEIVKEKIKEAKIIS